jgi:hypothetical protein
MCAVVKVNFEDDAGSAIVVDYRNSGAVEANRAIDRY